MWKISFTLELPIKFDEIFKDTSVIFFIVDFSWWICELDNFTFKSLYWITFYIKKEN